MFNPLVIAADMDGATNRAIPSGQRWPAGGRLPVVVLSVDSPHCVPL